MRIVLTNKANQSIEKIAKYIKHKFGEKRAEAFLDEIDQNMFLLLTNPNMGRSTGLYKKCAVDYKILVINEVNSIIYYIDKDDIVISLCFDNRQDPKNIMKKI